MNTLKLPRRSVRRSIIDSTIRSGESLWWLGVHVHETCPNIGKANIYVQRRRKAG